MSEYENYEGIEREGSVEREIPEEEFYVGLIHYHGDNQYSTVVVVPTKAKANELMRNALSGYNVSGEDAKGRQHYFKKGLIQQVEIWSKTKADEAARKREEMLAAQWEREDYLYGY